jgi:predicted transglutaminase-like cysteine proteinase
MRRILTLVAVATVSMVAGSQCANAGLLGMPMGLQSAIQHIKLETPTLPPMAYTPFCLRNEDECSPKIGMMFRGGPIRLTAERWADLKEVNETVNQDIVSLADGLDLILTDR